MDPEELQRILEKAKASRVRGLAAGETRDNVSVGIDRWIDNATDGRFKDIESLEVNVAQQANPVMRAIRGVPGFFTDLLNATGVEATEAPAAVGGFAIRPRQEPLTPAQTQAGARGLLQGASLGTSDEVLGGLLPRVTAEDLQQQNRESRGDFPGTTLGAEVLGGLLIPGAGTARVAARASTLPRRIGAAAALGGAEAGLAGAATADPGERLAGAGRGALLGAPLGGILGPTLGRRIVEGTGGPEAIRRTAQEALREQVGRRAGGVEGAAEAVRQLPPGAIPADVPALRNPAVQATRLGPEVRAVAEEATGRNARQVQNIDDALSASTGGRTADAIVDDTLDEARRLSDEYEQIAGEIGDAPFRAMQPLIDRLPKGIMRAAREMAQIAGRPLPEKGLDFRTLQFVKSSLDDRVNNLFIVKKAKQRAQNLRRFRNEFVDSMNEQVNTAIFRPPEFNAGRFTDAQRQWAQNLGIRDAVTRGRQAANMDAGMISRELAGMGGEAQDAFRVGMVDRFRQRLRESVDDGANADKFLRSQAGRDRLAIAVPDSRARQNILETAETARAVRQTDRQLGRAVEAGADVEAAAAGAPTIGGIQLAPLGARSAAFGGTKAAAVGLAQQLGAGLTRRARETQQAVQNVIGTPLLTSAEETLGLLTGPLARRGVSATQETLLRRSGALPRLFAQQAAPR